MLGLLLYSLFTHNSVTPHNSNTIINFADNMRESAYMEEVRDLAVWCQDNNPSLNVSKSKELIVDNR